MHLLMYAQPPRSYRSMQRMFRQHGVYMECCDSPEHFLDRAMTSSHDAAIYLHDGPTDMLRHVYAQWKAQGCTTLFVVVSRNQSGLERVRILALGVDAYHIEPYSYSDLLTEIGAHASTKHLRRGQTLHSSRFAVDLAARTATFDDRALDLSPTEFSLMHFLVRHRGQVVSRAQLWDELRPDREYPVGNIVDVHIGRLRRKIGVPEAIQSVHGIGYRLRADF